MATYWRKAAWPWASIGLLLALAIPAIAQAWPAKVVRITDGDTITVLNRDQVQLRIRLYGIDCPERKQPFGKKAKEFVAQLAGARQVDIHGTENDRYGRVIGLVILPDGTNLNLAIIDAGLGWVYRKYCTKLFCQDWLEAEDQARKARRGLWVDKNPVPPWDWRRK